MIIAALLVVSPNWKQPKYLLSGQWIDEPQSIYTVGCFLAIKLKDICTTTRMNFKITMLDGKSQARTHVYCKEFITSCLAMDDNLGRDKKKDVGKLFSMMDMSF